MSMNVYEFGDDASSLFALQARQAAAAHSITTIQSHTGEIGNGRGGDGTGKLTVSI